MAVVRVSVLTTGDQTAPDRWLWTGSILTTRDKNGSRQMAVVRVSFDHTRHNKTALDRWLWSGSVLTTRDKTALGRWLWSGSILTTCDKTAPNRCCGRGQFWTHATKWLQTDAVVGVSFDHRRHSKRLQTDSCGQGQF